MDDLFNRLLNQINENFSEHDIKKIKKAYALASMAHIDQVRDSGEPYITHPVNVALIRPCCKYTCCRFSTRRCRGYTDCIS
ncbi:MAG: hypothetical protein RR436_05495 [Clostridia bacterium]